MLTLRFHRELYSEEAIRNSMEAYAGHARIEIRSEEPYALVDLEPLGEDLAPALLGQEFANHVLARTIEERRSQ